MKYIKLILNVNQSIKKLYESRGGSLLSQEQIGMVIEVEKETIWTRPNPKLPCVFQDKNEGFLLNLAETVPHSESSYCEH